MRRRLPQGESDFAIIREGDYAYVDKTDLVWRLAYEQRYAFLSRPRRFGKSLLVSTFEAYFRGRQDLFHGLKMEGLEHNWAAYPVLRLDMSVGAASYDALNDQLSSQLQQWEQQYLPEGRMGSAPGTRFRDVIRAAYRKTGQRVVVLVDEYDSPLQASVLDADEHERVRSLYRDFFAVLKSESGLIRFCFLTGIAKFTQLSLFSTLNNLTNISFDPTYEAICGITESELTKDFALEVEQLADHLGCTVDDVYSRLRELYDGYRFCEDGQRLYNPYSLISALGSGRLRSYWYSSGQSSILSQMLGRVWRKLPDLEGSHISIDELETSDFSLDNPQVLLYQLGYLTIGGADDVMGEYELRFPNVEVRDALYKAVLPAMTLLRPDEVSQELRAFRAPLLAKHPQTDDVKASLQAFGSVLSSMPYPTGKNAEQRYERDAQLVLVTLAGAAGFRVSPEEHSMGGRADAVIETPSCVLLVELKLDKRGGVQAAREQLRDRGYSRPYLTSGKAVFEVAVGLSRDSQGVSAVDVKHVC